MRLLDLLNFTLQSQLRHRFRSAMMLIAMTIGVGSVVILSGLGEGARGWVMDQFSFLGSDTLIMLPGKQETTGGIPPLTGTAARDITIDQVEILKLKISAIEAIAPLVAGNSEVSRGGLSREVITLGTSRAFFDLRDLQLGQGIALPDIPLSQSRSICVLGGTLKEALFGNANALGEWVRVESFRCRVIGVLFGRNDAMGMDLSDALIMPVANAMTLYNTQALFRVFIKVRSGQSLDTTEQRVTEMMTQLHQGEDDITVIRPDALISTFDDIIRILTLAVSAIASISLLVAGVLIMNITLISVNQRRREIGLLKAIGSPARQIRLIFLTEAALLSLLGGICGLLLAFGVLSLANQFLADFNFQPPLWSIAGGIVTALGCGIVFAWLPSRRAARLEPVEALNSP